MSTTSETAAARLSDADPLIGPRRDVVTQVRLDGDVF